MADSLYKDLLSSGGESDNSDNSSFDLDNSHGRRRHRAIDPKTLRLQALRMGMDKKLNMTKTDVMKPRAKKSRHPSGEQLAGRRALAERNLKSKSPAKYRAAAFPGMTVPVRMRQRNKGDRGFGRAVVEAREPVRAPVMSVQCPLPGGTVTTMAADPVQKIIWGPTTTIEASKKARDLLKQWLEAPEDAEDEDKVKDEKGNNHEISVAAVDAKSDCQEAENETLVSHAETVAAVKGRRLLKPPPPTPPDTVFHQALSMPTLPTLHHISDVNLVEQYRLQHATDPEAFEKETKAIKKGLIDAKVARGGKARILQNEYTVELASREDAQTVEKWTGGEIVQMRSRRNTMTHPSGVPADLEDIKMRGGEIEAGHSASAEGAKKDEESTTTGPPPLQSPPLIQVEHRISGTGPTEPSSKPTDDNPTTKSNRPVLTRAEVKSRLHALDLTKHVAKFSRSGSVRHQHSVKRETSDHGEKRTVKTWIEITEVYEVPSEQALTLKDLVAAVEADTSDAEETGDGDSDSNSEEEKSKKKGKKLKNKKSKKTKANASAKAKGKGKAKSRANRTKITATDSDGGDEAHDYDTDSSSLSTTSSSSTDSDSKGFTDPHETSAEALFRSLARVGHADAESINRLAGDLRSMIADLRVEGLLDVQEE